MVKGRLRLGQAGPSLAELEALLDVANRGEVFVQLVLVLAVDPLGETVRVHQPGIENGSLQTVLLVAPIQALLGIADKEPVKQLSRPGDGRHTHAGFRPRDLAATVDAALGTDRQRREPRLMANLVGHELVDGDIAARPVLRFRIEDAREERMHREVTALDPVVESAVNRQVLTHIPERFEQRGLLVGRAGRFGKELLYLIAEQIPHRDETPSAGPGTLGCLYGRISTHGIG